MNIKEIINKNDLDVLLNEDILITHDTSLLKEEICHNMWCIELEDKASRKINANDILKFIEKLLFLKQKQIKQNIIKGPITFYLWVDEMANQLRFNFISGCVDDLPFGCFYILRNKPDQIISHFFNIEPLHFFDVTNEDAEIEEDDTPITIDVFRKCLK